jgi:hypothetical protein
MVANCWAIGRSSLEATKALLMRIARAEGRRLCRAVSLDREPLRAGFADAVVFFAPVCAVLFELVLDELALPGLAGVSDDCAAAIKTSNPAASAPRKTRARISAAKGDDKDFIRSL